ncbi:hypothetical protein Cst_c25180 [Thermoclostridium stercorarium subsp. stercorarium DSM 8532]|uniref:Uncharacterized protein n=1 Tax=Thermoclostridium stercorarium (strain ATCC 35414 / DSM 8532 / NCIMB 11754) TaxID=1121335 RepID=L7VMM7_THES1|nr:hypothetical protein Cst_c25180 [Thermoclostridium stercorarium subsp. stercorarium DSM 8532]
MYEPYKNWKYLYCSENWFCCNLVLIQYKVRIKRLKGVKRF